VAWHQGDIADGEAVGRVVREAAPEVVCHMAAVLIPVCRAEPARAAAIDVIGHINAFEAAADAGCRHVIYASSASATARTKEGTLATVYGTFKHWNEEFAATRLIDRGIASVGLRPAIVYGPGREAGATSFVNNAIADAVAGRPHVLTTRWMHRVEYVEEIAEAFVRCCAARIKGAHACDITTVQSDEAHFMAALARVLPQAQVTIDGEAGFREIGKADTARLAALIGPLRSVGLDEGIARTVEGMRHAA